MAKMALSAFMFAVAPGGISPQVVHKKTSKTVFVFQFHKCIPNFELNPELNYTGQLEFLHSG
jgi:hypothetical protein